MKLKYQIIILLFAFKFNLAQVKDTLSYKRVRFLLEAGVYTNSYFIKSLKISDKPLGLQFGIGFQKEINERQVFETSLNYFNLNLLGIDNSVNDAYFNLPVNIKTNINLKRLYFRTGIHEKINQSFSIGALIGINVLLNSKIEQSVIIDDTTSVGINLYNKYIVYQTQGKSIFTNITPCVGVTCDYNIKKPLVFRLSLTADLKSQPYNNFVFIKSFYIITPNISLIFKPKKNEK